MPEIRYILLAISVAAAITFGLRALPFLFKNALRESALLGALNQWMPLGIMVILVIYCLAGMRLDGSALARAQLVALAVTVLVHGWRRNLFLTMVVGTGTCVVLANYVL